MGRRVTNKEVLISRRDRRDLNSLRELLRKEIVSRRRILIKGERLI